MSGEERCAAPGWDSMQILGEALGYRFEEVVRTPDGYAVVLRDSSGDDLAFEAETCEAAVDLAVARLSLLTEQA